MRSDKEEVNDLKEDNNYNYDYNDNDQRPDEGTDCTGCTHSFIADADAIAAGVACLFATIALIFALTMSVPTMLSPIGTISSSNANPVGSAVIEALIAENESEIIPTPAIAPVAMPIPIFFPSKGSPEEAQPKRDDNAPNAAPPPKATKTPVNKSIANL